MRNAQCGPGGMVGCEVDGTPVFARIALHEHTVLTQGYFVTHNLPSAQTPGYRPVPSRAAARRRTGHRRCPWLRRKRAPRSSRVASAGPPLLLDRAMLVELSGRLWEMEAGQGAAHRSAESSGLPFLVPRRLYNTRGCSRSSQGVRSQVLLPSSMPPPRQSVTSGTALGARTVHGSD